MFISHCSKEALANAAEKLRSGSLIAFPTETVYGLGADADNENAVARIYKVKGRPADHPLIVHIADLDQVDYWACEIPEYAISLMRDFWPGPMTLVLKRKNAKDFITGGQETVGLRIPAQQIALSLLKEFQNLGGHGIAAPSANRFGAVSPTTAAAVQEEIGNRLDKSDQILDGGPCLVGLESTIIDCTGEAPRILRPGAISEIMIEESTGLKLRDRNEKIRVSGSLDQHYSPRAEVFIEGDIQDGDGFLALAEIPTPPNAIRISSPSTIEEFARILYQSLRDADARGLKRIKVILPAGNGLAFAIRDRVTRAAR